MKKYWLSAVVVWGIVVSGSAAAEINCAIPPSCEELGYTDNIADCDPRKGVLRCPFDNRAIFCRKYRWSDCEFGATLYSDGKCYDDVNAAYNVPSGVTSVGFVFDEVNKVAMTLADAPNEYNWEDAVIYCDSLSNENVKGMLPNVEQITTVMTMFPDKITPLADYWTSIEEKSGSVTGNVDCEISGSNRGARIVYMTAIGDPNSYFKHHKCMKNTVRCVLKY